MRRRSATAEIKNPDHEEWIPPVTFSTLMAGRCRSCRAWNSDEGRSPTPRRRSQSGTRWRREGRLIRLFIPEFERALEVIAFPRWAMISVAGATVATGAPVACLVAGIISTPIADRLRLPFAAVASLRWCL